MNNAVVKSILIVFGLIALSFGLWVAVTNSSKNGPLISEEVGIVYPKAREIGEFNLVDFDNKSIDQEQFKKKWWLVYFGFTYCPDACPVALNDMKKIKSQLDEKIARDVGFVFISVDPNRDTPQRLKEYVSYFDPTFYAATGTDEALQGLATRMGAVFYVPESPEDENYIVDHSTFMLFLNPAVNLQAIFKAPHKAENVAKGIKAIIAAS